jgi:peroxiredoxin
MYGGRQPKQTWIALIMLGAVLVGCGTGSPAPTSQPDTVATATQAGEEVAVEVGKFAPDFTAKLTNGQTMSLKDLRGKVVLINFWATWCTPCRREMPSFQGLADRLDKKDFQVLAINFQETPDQISKFTEPLALKFDVALDQDGKINRLYGVNQYPVSYVIGRDGKILAQQYGPFSSEEVLEQALKKWIAGA